MKNIFLIFARLILPTIFMSYLYLKYEKKNIYMYNV